MENKTIDYKKTVDIRYDADVVVVGGGPSGVAAAVAAARQGKKTILLELSGTLGGASVLSMVAELMNFDDGKNFLSNGVGRQIFERLSLKDARKREWHNIRYEELKRAYDDIVKEAGVQVLFYCRVIDAVCRGGTIQSIVVSGPSEIFAINGSFFIDCTGTGSLSLFAGADYEYGDQDGNTMSATICSLWGGVDFSKKGWDGQHYKKAYEDGVFSQYDSVLPGIKENYPEIGVGGGNVGHCFKVDDRDVESLTDAMFSGRKILSEYENYYRNYVAGCKDAVLIKSADYIGIRESRRIVCEYMLSGDDFYKDEAFSDEIGRYSYPIDIHPMTPDKNGMQDFVKAVSMRHEDGQSYSIPYRSLIPKKVDNLLVAGRCIGADRAMQASLRVIPCCYITGQAAGCAAAVCVEDNVRAKDADIGKIKRYIDAL
ncbi:MAG: FAD-dependent oxidoreductase [Oscillospiraceae bacterium]|nr:FAD-dependent oxidoreductase [Oscillospiraceae bacterium]